jgi:hypothetical protein
VAEQYTIRVRMKAGPFAVDDKAETTLRKAQLQGGG